MRLLFFTYCLSVAEGQAQIGVYKRGLRVAVEMANRGHEVQFFATGRQNFHDALTAEADVKLDFVELPFQSAAYEGADANRAAFLVRYADRRPDVVVIGEAPMAGTLLEGTLSAVESGIPVVLLDNAYGPLHVDAFCDRHGSMFDGMVLNGPSGFFGATDHPYLVQVPPYVDSSPAEARKHLRTTCGLDSEQLMVVLAYDPNVAELGISLLEQLEDPDLDVVFVTPTPDALADRLAALPHAARRVRAFPPPNERLLFGLLEAGPLRDHQRRVHAALRVLRAAYAGDRALLPDGLPGGPHPRRGQGLRPRHRPAGRRRG